MQKITQVVHMHHTEICHSSVKLYKEKLVEFFTQLSQYYNQEMHEVVITADIGRNEKVNSCGGKDHSNETSLETFSIYLGKNASTLSGKEEYLMQHEVLSQKF